MNRIIDFVEDPDNIFRKANRLLDQVLDYKTTPKEYVVETHQMESIEEEDIEEELAPEDYEKPEPHPTVIVEDDIEEEIKIEEIVTE